MRRILLWAAIAAVALLVVALVLDGFAMHGNALARRFPDGLRIGYAVEAPYAFVDEGGTVTGESPTLVRHVAARLGLAVSFVQADFDSLLDQLDEGRYDVIAAGLFITPERARRVRFSLPTFRTSGAALVRAGNPRRLHSLDDIRAAGATVAVLAASVEEARVRAAGLSSARILAVPNAAAARRALEAGRADAVMLSGPTVRWMAAQHASGGVEVAAPFDAGPEGPGTASLGALAFRQSDHELADAVDDVLAALVGTPEHLALIQPFGFTRRSLPPPAVRHARGAP